MIALTVAGRTSRHSGTGLAAGTLTGTANVYAVKRDCFLATIHCLHEIDLNCDIYVFSFALLLLLLTAPLLATSKDRLELLKDALKAIELLALPAILPLASSTSEAFPKRTITSKRVETASTTEWKSVSTSLLLFVTRHTGLVINLPLLWVTNCLVSRIYFCELFLCSLLFVDIWMILLRKFEVCLLYFILRGRASNP